MAANMAAKLNKISSVRFIIKHLHLHINMIAWTILTKVRENETSLIHQEMFEYCTKRSI